MGMNEGINKSYELTKIREKYNFNKRSKGLDFNTSELVDGGMNYNQFVKIHNRFIQEDAKIIGFDGCYVLFYLISYAHNREYIETTISIIQNNINLSKEKISNALKLLHKNELIFVKGLKDFSKDIGTNTVLDIIIIYDNDKLYDVTLNNTIGLGYKAIPIDYIKYSVAKLNSTEFSILLCLILRFRYYLPCKAQTDTGETFYTYQAPEYAFPKLKTIGEYFNSTRKTIKKHIEGLAEKEFITYEPNGKDLIKKYNPDTGEDETINPNYKYRIYLLQRLEYMYYNYYILPNLYDDANKQKDRDYILKQLKTKGFETIATSELNTYILEKDYIKYTYGTQMEDFSKALKDKNLEMYRQLDKKIIGDFRNEDMIDPTKRKN